MDKRLRIIVSILAIGLLTGCGSSQAPIASAAAKVTHYKLDNAKIDEASGLAPSRRADNVLYTHNDSGGEPAIYAISLEGKFLGTIAVAGMDNIDWEDIASFKLDGRAYILIADTGDNSAHRKDCALYVIEEPDPALLSPEKEILVPVSWTIPLTYPGGPQDCESVAVDVGIAPDHSDARAYLLLKREYPNRLLTVPLLPPPPPIAANAPKVHFPSSSASAAPATKPVPPTRPEQQTAWLIANVSSLPQPDSAQRLLPTPTGRYRGQPTGMDFAPDGSAAVVLTYGDLLLYKRNAGETWLTAFSRDPVKLPSHGLGQAEAVCFSRDGKSIYVTEEAKHAPLLRYDLE